jgi:uncharacterized protein YdcH (DUF465 family)
MEDYERARIESLLDEDDELRKLWEQHLEFERRLEELDALPHLTPEEEIERKRIQKLKLAGKDRLAERVARCQNRS